MPTFNAYTGDLIWDYWTSQPTTNNTTAAEEIVIDANTPLEKEVIDYLLGKHRQCCEGDECQEKPMELQEVLGF